MAHKTLIGGTAYEISDGKTLVDGTAYSIKNGKTLVGGTAYEIPFFSGPIITLIGSGRAYRLQNEKGIGCYIKVDGVQYVDATELKFPVGTIVECCAWGTKVFLGKITINGSDVAVISTSGYQPLTYNYTVTTDATIILNATYDSMSDICYGTITITEH